MEAHLHMATIPGFHVNSDKPLSDNIIPLRLTWNAGPLEATAIRYPKPETIELGPDKLTVFSGSFEITTVFTAPGNAAAGSTEVTGHIRYQACNNRMCFRPSTIDVRIPVTIQ